MKISTRTRYGTRALLDLALHQGENLVPFKDIAQRQQVSPQYLEHLMTPLINSGIVRSVRGSKGGLLLGRSPNQISLSEVFKILKRHVNYYGVCQ